MEPLDLAAFERVDDTDETTAALDWLGEMRPLDWLVALVLAIVIAGSLGAIAGLLCGYAA